MDIGDYFDDDYLEKAADDEYLEKWSPNLDQGFSEYSSNESDDDEELNIDSPWVFSVRPGALHVSSSKRRRNHNEKSSDESHRRKYQPNRIDGILINTMSPELELALAAEAERALAEAKNNDESYNSFNETRRYSNRHRANPRFGTPPRNNVRKRLGLPIVLQSIVGSVELVIACPDSGSDENIVSLDLVTRLGLQVLPCEDKTFSLANGRVVTAVGRTVLHYSFSTEISIEARIMDKESLTSAYVFTSLVVPAILGEPFLKQTETLTKHRDRLIEEIIPSMQALRVNSIGKPQRSVVCRLDDYVSCAFADTGSDLDLVSPQFAKTRAFVLEPGEEKLEFADGSIGFTSGVIQASFTLGNVDQWRGFIPRGQRLDLEFFVLDSLTSDVLVGQDTLHELELFNHHSDSFIDSTLPPGLPDCNIIRHIGRLETKVSNAIKSATDFMKTKTDMGHPYDDIANSQDDARSNTLLEIQRENARHESTLPSVLDDSSVATTFNSMSVSPITNTFRCTYTGCTAPPFQTQYLLNSHASVHSSTRPHYCPVRGCPRSEGGKGFERKNEMIRHGLIHESPGFACPFCPDRDHKYPRPDNLQRHVRVHHVDKSKDDPILHEVFNRQPEKVIERRRRSRAVSIDSDSL